MSRVGELRNRRPSLDELYARMAYLVSTRSTCRRRSVGCVLVDAYNRVLSTGYNGVARGQPHCNSYVLMERSGVEFYPHACPGSTATSGTRIDECGAIHAEQNALVQCGRVDMLRTCYVTTCPCMSCLKLLLGTPCERLVYSEPYPGGLAALELWRRSGRRALLLPVPDSLGGALARAPGG